tara:strand:- start:502 stop:699 length:198 start_codon:yes stop_codon:yes gene_type:complete
MWSDERGLQMVDFWFWWCVVWMAKNKVIRLNKRSTGLKGGWNGGTTSNAFIYSRHGGWFFLESQG